MPLDVDGLMVACRAFSSDMITNDTFNWIPQYIAFGEAAGTAAAIAVKHGSKPREVDYRTLQKQLLSQGAILPGVNVPQPMMISVIEILPALDI